MNQPLVQILVKVAIIEEQFFNAEVDNGFVGMAIDYELDGVKRKPKGVL